MTDNKIKLAAKWAAEEFERRTLEIAKGNKISFYWIDPSTRVSWHEICQHFNMEVVGPTDRVEFQPLFKKEIYKRKLAKVLSGKEKSDQWAKRVGKMDV